MAPTRQSGALYFMFRILKIETLRAGSAVGAMHAAFRHEPRVSYLAEIDTDYGWHADRERALAFPTREGAAAAVKTYRERHDDRRSHIEIIGD